MGEQTKKRKTWMIWWIKSEQKENKWTNRKRTNKKQPKITKQKSQPMNETKNKCRSQRMKIMNKQKSIQNK